jgi:hypothetical protein
MVAKNMQKNLKDLKGLNSPNFRHSHEVLKWECIKVNTSSLQNEQ